MLKYIEKQTCTSTQRRKSLDFGLAILDFGLTPASSVELEKNGFGLDDFSVLKDGTCTKFF